MSHNFKCAIVQFENASAAQTETIVIALEDAKIGYEHVTGRTGYLVGICKKEFKSLQDKAEDIVHSINDGMWCEVTERTMSEDELDDMM